MACETIPPGNIQEVLYDWEQYTQDDVLPVNRQLFKREREDEEVDNSNVSIPVNGGIDTVKMTKRAKTEDKCHTEDVIEFIGWCASSTATHDFGSGVTKRFTCAHQYFDGDGKSTEEVKYVVGEIDPEGFFYLHLTKSDWARRTDVPASVEGCFYADAEWITRNLVKIGVLDDTELKTTLEIVDALFPKQYESPTSPVPSDASDGHELERSESPEF